MRIAVINLERSPQKRAAMAAALDGLGLSYGFFKGLDASRDEQLAISRYDEAAALRYFGHRLNPGEIACFASHYSLWQHCVAIDEPLLIMEDDVTLTADFPRAVALADELTARCGLIRLAGLSSRRALASEDLPDGFRAVRLEKGGVGTQCYAISPSAARTLLLHAATWTAPVDYFVDAFWVHGQLNYALLPYRAKHSDNSHDLSDIGARQPYRPRGLRDWRRHYSKQRDWVLRKIYNLTHRAGALHPS